MSNLGKLALVFLAMTARAETSDQEDDRVLEHGIYRCDSAHGLVYADERDMKKFHDCKEIRAPKYREEVAAPKPVPAAAANTPAPPPAPSSCRGAIVYQGGTYLFNEREPCPIPDAVFRARKPLEAMPQYYTKP